MKKYSRFVPTKRALLFWCIFIGIGAVAGATGMLMKPDGSILQMQTMLPYFQVLPFADVLFQDYVFSGIALLIVNGISNLTAAVLMLLHKKSGVLLGGIFGLTLMAWICIQFVIFPLNFLSTAYFIFGLIQALTGYAAWIFLRQEEFVFRREDYKNVGSAPENLVVYFSRLGYTRKIAYEIADRSGAAVYEIRASEPTAGTKGFWWCGRYGMHGWDMPIVPPEIDLTEYARVTVCTPIWVFAIAAPVRAFCRMAAGKIKSVDYVAVHHLGCRFENAAREMDELLRVKHTAFRSVCCKTGTYKESRNEETAVVCHAE